MSKFNPTTWTIIALFPIFMWGCSGSKEAAKTEPQFEGKVVYEIEYRNLPAQYQQMSSALPKENTVYIRNHLSRQESQLGMGNTQTTIVNAETDSTTMLVNLAVMGKKVKVSTARTGDSIGVNDPDVKKLDSTGSYAGKECKMVKFRLSEDDEYSKVCYTDAIPSGPFNQFKALNGFPLMFETSRGNFTTIMKAKEITETKVPDSKFDTNVEGYEEMTMEEFRNMLGNMRGQ